MKHNGDAQVINRIIIMTPALDPEVFKVFCDDGVIWVIVTKGVVM